MNKQAVQKVKLFCGGMQSRFLENKDLFIEVSGSYQSGTVSYPFSILFEGETYVLTFQKETIRGAFDTVFSHLIEQANLYDILTLTYADRTGRLMLRADNKNVSTKSDNQVAEVSKGEEKHIISPKAANKLLRVLDFVSENGKLKNTHVRKFTQAEHFIELLVPYLKKLPQDREITVYDLACGKSYLSFFLNFYLCDVMKRRCRIIGVDIREDVVEASKKIRDELKYYNMDFYCADILEFTPPTRMDVAISLHACDVATDFAIAVAVNNGAQIAAIAPCCHKEFLDTIKTEEMPYFTENGIFKKRFSDLLTDIYRVKTLEEQGYAVVATEFVSPLETPKNLLILAEKTKNASPKGEATRAIKRAFHVDPILDKLIF
ncbi:MAG: SAM-dependent methyltransferase [Clostridia bacterium]|nr:SAM-dependent methyltransferase [Clostridia bacterium]